MKAGLWIGRFQPYTLGHDDGYSQIERLGVDKLILGVGSAQEEWTAKNPLSFYERKEMLSRVFDTKDIDYEIFPIPDFGDTKRWVKYITEEVPSFEKVYSGNPYVEVCFRGKGKKFVLLNVRDGIKASNVRENIVNNLEWKSSVPEMVADYLEKIGLKSRLEKLIERQKPRNPELATDAIIEYGKGIVLIERVNEPYGWALPGGFVDRGESAENAIVREAKEETGLEFSIEGLVGFYSEPNRDPRRHVASAVYWGKGKGELGAFDDAKDSMVVSVDDALRRDDLVFDHKRIIEDYAKMKNGKNAGS